MTKPKLGVDLQEELFVRLGRDNRLAHQVLFAHRHPNETPDFHYEIIDDLHGPSPRVIELAFRGAGKSTIAEEYIALDACYQRFRNFIIIGESFTRAAERLATIKHEIDFNDHIRALFGDLHGPTWNEDKAILSNGVVLQAFGRGQSLRGTKHDDVRPDACLIDDLEDEESVNSPEQRDKTQQWLMRTLLPALAPGAKVRMLANMLDPDCLAVRLRKTGVWTVREYPWEYIAPDGARLATWPARFPLEHIDGVKREYEAAGMLNEYMQEYMVQATDPSTRVFTNPMLRVEPTARRWEPTYAFYDPARTVKTSSAHTGKVVFSWVGTRLIVWEGDGQLWMPDKIIDDMFEVSSTYASIAIGVEKDGLEEFLLQPLRAEQTRRHEILPLKPMKAPVGKLQFIRSLQPFFASGEVIFAKDLPVLKQQLLSFPTGRIDVPNALAYALRMRPGLPIYENFTHRNVQEDLAVLRTSQGYLAIGATRQYTCAALLQVAGTSLRVVADWVREGDPGTTLEDIFTEAGLICPKITAYAPAAHWANYDTIGLQPAAKKLKQKISMGGDPAIGREELRKKLEALSHGQAALLVSTRARWTLNGFSGGYARSVPKDGKALYGVADEGPYKTLMEALESFIAVAANAIERDGADSPNYATDSQGRRYLSARAHHRGT
ncbi:MAG: hypothetical protein KGL35_24960 [Bradyrhizobium sp.]|nr:hypothetical protein [Bradyrhizobium sp.]